MVSGIVYDKHRDKLNQNNKRKKTKDKVKAILSASKSK